MVTNQLELEISALLTSQDGGKDRINFKGAVFTHADVKTKKTLLMLYLPYDISLGSFFCVLHVCI